MPVRRTYRPIPFLALALVAAGCEEATRPSLDDPQVTLSFQVEGDGLSFSRSPGLSAATAPAATLKLDSVQLVLAEIRLSPARDSAKCDGGNRCGSFKTGPVLVSLPLAGGKITPFATLPPAGTYNALEFKIHRPEGNDSVTRAFRAAHPTWPASAAIRVVGTYDGKRFESFFRTEASIKQAFAQPLVIDAATQLSAVGLTVAVKIDQWFRDAQGGVINPAELTSNQRLLALVEKNIRESFRTRLEKKPDQPGDRGKGDDKGKGDEKGKGNDRNGGKG